MNKKRLLVILASLVISIGIVVVALVVAQHKRSSYNNLNEVPQRTVSKAELVRSNGKNGHACLVAVDGFVYKIQGFSLWQNGKHLSSRGQAYCGADMTAAIDKSPHGRSVLKLLIKIGPLGN